MNTTQTNERVLCLRLKKMRETACISVTKLSKKTGIAPMHIRALEKCEYEKLPQGNVRKTIVRQYAQAIGTNPEPLELHFQELETKQNHPKASGGKHTTRSFPTTLRIMAASLGVCALLAYLGMEIHNMIGPPKLLIENPTTNIETHISHIDITGKTTPESHVTINGLKTTLDTTGNFTETLHLKEGINEILITSESKRGGKSSAARSVLYTPDISKAAATTFEPQL